MKECVCRTLKRSVTNNHVKKDGLANRGRVNLVQRNLEEEEISQDITTNNYFLHTITWALKMGVFGFQL